MDSLRGGSNTGGREPYEGHPLRSWAPLSSREGSGDSEADTPARASSRCSCEILRGHGAWGAAPLRRTLRGGRGWVCVRVCLPRRKSPGWRASAGYRRYDLSPNSTSPRAQTPNEPPNSRCEVLPPFSSSRLVGRRKHRGPLSRKKKERSPYYNLVAIFSILFWAFFNLA